ncbi:MAG: hypothetical protein ACI9TV_003043 [Sulfurimonas sp.]|jgi:hypothetical protein|uniref:DUF1987 domain-containing protein n=1 Tax=Sulfurimonas sp. TaxID=2022749 RepID=UPI0039E4A6D8
MENLNIPATKSSPEINFDASTNILSIIGESYPENTTQFYETVFVWLEEFIDKLQSQEATVNIELIYFNSSSSKVLMDLFDILEEASEDDKNIVVNWIYDEDNEASLEYGEEFAEDIESLTFNLVEK